MWGGLDLGGAIAVRATIFSPFHSGVKIVEAIVIELMDGEMG